MSSIHHADLITVKTRACEIAEELQQVFITPEHFLLALITSDCKATKFLSETFGQKKLESVLRDYLSSFTCDSDKAITEAEAPQYSLRAQRIINAAESFSEIFKSKVNSLHLLWAILQDSHCFAVHTMIDLHKQARLAKNEKTSKSSKANQDELSNEDIERLIADWCTKIEKMLISAGSRRPALMSLTSEKRSSDAQFWRKRLSAAGEKLLSKQVIQSSAIKRVANALTRSWADVMGTDRPMASFLFVGPRGSGKRSLARNMANFLYTSSDRLHSLSLGDFSEELRLTQLVSNAPENSEQDATQEGALTRLAQEYPYSVIYLEDVERANSKTMDTIHQLLKHGHIVDSQGKLVDFRGNVIILSLSIDPMFFERDQPVGLRSNVPGPSNNHEGYERMLMPDLERILRADTLGLVDEVVFFPPLTDEEMKERAKVLFLDLSRNLRHQYDIELQIDDSVYEFLMKRLRDLGKDTGTLRRVFTREVSNAVAQYLLANKLKAGDTALLKGPVNGDKHAEGEAISVEKV